MSIQWLNMLVGFLAYRPFGTSWAATPILPQKKYKIFNKFQLDWSKYWRVVAEKPMPIYEIIGFSKLVLAINIFKWDQLIRQVTYFSAKFRFLVQKTSKKPLKLTYFKIMCFIKKSRFRLNGLLKQFLSNLYEFFSHKL